jgi:hypothetical protein
MRIPGEWRKAIDQGRLLLLPPFTATQRRATAELAQERNRFAAAIADEVWFIYATSHGALAALAQSLKAQGKQIIMEFP